MAKKLAFDKTLLTAVLALVALGLTMVYSASSVVARELGGSPESFLLNQGVAAVVGLVLMGLALAWDYRRLKRPAVIYAGLGLVVLALLAVLFGPQLNETRRWLFLGGTTFQPAEAAKIAVVAFLAFLMDRRHGAREPRGLLGPVVMVVGLIVALILLQPDLGSAVLVALCALMVLFLAGLPWRHISTLALFVTVGALVAAVLATYRMQRLLVFLDPERDPLGAGFQIQQSLIAVGSGGLFGRGLGNSLQKLHFLPHPHSDFVYSIVAEELGMIGAIGVVVLFGVLVWRGARAGMRAPDEFGRYLAWGLSGALVLQALIHVSVALALLPTKGIPLPFISHGGSSLVASMVSAGLVLNVSQHA